mgnify:CR=1 FL=1
MINSDFQIGDKVKKRTNHAFKSSFKINTIKGFTVNPHSPKADNRAASFVEDDSIVNLDRLVKC